MIHQDVLCNSIIYGFAIYGIYCVLNCFKQKTIYMDDDDEIIEEKDEITFVKLGKRKKLI